MTPPAAAPPRAEVVTRDAGTRRQAWIERATSADHKVVATMFIATALAFLALAAVQFALMRMQLFLPENTLIAPEIFNRLLTVTPVTLLVLSAIPLVLGLIGHVVPLQIGARGAALPRLNQLSYWLYLFGGVTIYATFLYQAPESGTAAFAPLSDTPFTPSNGTDAWIAGTALAVLGFTCFAINLLVTVNRMRAPGIAWRRLPLFSAAASVIGWILVVAGPVLLAALTMLFIDRRFGGVFFDPGEGGAPLLYQHMAYFFLTSAYLAIFLAGAGVISEIVQTFARKPIFSHRAVAASFAAIGVLGPLAWMQNMYSAPLNEGWTIMAMFFALALVVPVGVLFYNWIATIWGGSLELRAATWWALAAISMCAIGLSAELANSVIPFGWALANTTASQADTLYVIVGAGVIGGFAGLHYWFPKLCGRRLGEGLGKAALGMILVGLNLYGLMMFFAGLEGQPVDVYEYFADLGLDGLNLIASLGGFLLVLGILVQLANAAYSWNNGLPARMPDPWGGSTLEWFALSPPPPHNFDAVPDVRSTEPLHDIRGAVRRRIEAFEPPVGTAAAAREREPVGAEAQASGASGGGDPGAGDGEGTPVA